jgi:hypothetical protein
MVVPLECSRNGEFAQVGESPGVRRPDGVSLAAWAPQSALAGPLGRACAASIEVDVPTPTVLVLSQDALAAALLGAAVEYAGFAPLFARQGESSRDALRRLRPAVVLVDCDDEDACAESFIGPVMMMGARVVVFGSARSRRDVAGLVGALRLSSFTLPIDHETLARLLREAVAEG